MRSHVLITSLYRLSIVVLIIFFVSCKNDADYQSITKENAIISDKVIPDSDFLGDRNCKECHAKEFDEWHGSDHDKAMQIADSLSVLGDFNNSVFKSQGVTSRFYRQDQGYYVNTEGPDGKNHDYKIVYTFGVKPLQQYIVKFPKGHYQCLRTAWDTVKKRWFDLYPDFKVVHSEWLHWSRGGLNWNAMCSDCHSTNVRKNYDQKTDTYNTKYALINVNCEACHGPGKQHVEEVKRLGKAYHDSETMHMTLTTSPRDLVDQCARCHMRREQFSANFNFQGTLLDHYFPQLIETPIYYPDGQISDEDYVYGSFIQSKMYRNNVACNNCHNTHSLKLKFEGNALCAQCHLPQKFDTPEHHFHKMGTDGALCVNCHMPGKYYMGVDFRRDHSFRVPRPDLSLKYGTPNACAGCHKKDDKWAWDAFQKLYGTVDSTHFSDKLVPGILGDPKGDLLLLDLINDHKQPEMVRASAVKALSRYNSAASTDVFLGLLQDKSALVRGTVVDVLSELNTTNYANNLLPLLEDPKRAVRVKTFFALGGLKEDHVPKRYQAAYKRVKKEFFTYLNINSDFPGGQMREGNYYLKKGDVKKAIENYEKALEIDNLNNQARFNLANLYYNNGDLDKAEAAFKTIIGQEPSFGPTYYSLALLYAEQDRYEEAITLLNKASKIMPDNIRVFYNLSLLYDKTNKQDLAEKALVNGLRADANNESLLYALAFHYYKNGHIEKAKNILVKMVRLFPDNSQYSSFLNQLKAKG